MGEKRERVEEGGEKRKKRRVEQERQYEGEFIFDGCEFAFPSFFFFFLVSQAEPFLETFRPASNAAHIPVVRASVHLRLLLRGFLLPRRVPPFPLRLRLTQRPSFCPPSIRSGRYEL